MKSIAKNVIYSQLPRLFKWPNSDSLIASTYLLLGSFQLFLMKLVDMIWIKVQILWEGHKIWKNLPPVLTKQLFLLSSVKKSGRFFQIFVAFSEKLDFTLWNHFLISPGGALAYSGTWYFSANLIGSGSFSSGLRISLAVSSSLDASFDTSFDASLMVS